jgi:hypothetical protein
MSKTFTAQQFEIEFYAAMSKWVSGGKVGPDPRGEWEWRDTPTSSWDFSICMREPMWLSDCEYRWKPAKKRTVLIDGVELVAPEVGAPTDGAQFFIESMDGIVLMHEWNISDLEHRVALKNGKVFLTREDAQAMADALRKQRMGQQSKPIVTDEMVVKAMLEHMMGGAL